MLRRLIVIAVVFVLFGTLILPVGARRAFCSADPIFSAGGKRVEVVVELAPYEMKDLVSVANPIKVVFYSPPGTDPKVELVGGEFAEEAFAQEHNMLNVAAVRVSVPDLPGLQAVRVTVIVDGQQVRRLQLPRRELTIVFPWK